MTNRQPKIPLVLRIIAAGCMVVWLAGVSACNLETLFGCVHQDSEALAHTDSGHSQREHGPDANAHHAHDAVGHLHGSDPHESNEESCCSTLKAILQNAQPVVLKKPAFPAIPYLCMLSETYAAALALAGNPPNREAKTRDRIFTPGVCLGPAHRSLAPPARA